MINVRFCPHWLKLNKQYIQLTFFQCFVQLSYSQLGYLATGIIAEHSVYPKRSNMICQLFYAIMLIYCNWNVIFRTDDQSFNEASLWFFCCSRRSSFGSPRVGPDSASVGRSRWKWYLSLGECKFSVHASRYRRKIRPHVECNKLIFFDRSE